MLITPYAEKTWFWFPDECASVRPSVRPFVSSPVRIHSNDCIAKVSPSSKQSIDFILK